MVMHNTVNPGVQIIFEVATTVDTVHFYHQPVIKQRKSLFSTFFNSTTILNSWPARHMLSCSTGREYT